MTSNTGDLSNFINRETLINRNAFSAVKYNQSYGQSLQLTPLPLFIEDFKKELEEAEKEPLPTIIIDEEEESSVPNENDRKHHEEKVKLLSKIDEDDSLLNLENELKNLAFKTPRLSIKKQSVENRLKNPEVPLVTTGKLTKNVALKSKKQIFNSNCYLSKGKILNNKADELATPLKVQCTIEVPTHLRTPLTNLSSKKKPKEKKDLSLSFLSNNTIETKFEKIKVKHTEYLILSELGKGGSSIVFHCFDYNTKNQRAIKRVSLNNSTSAISYLNEVEVLKNLQHCDKIIKMYDFEVVENENVLLVVLEVGGADLAKILKDLSTNKHNLPLYMIIFYWMEMLYAIKQIHSNGIIHCDLKPANFLKAENGLKLIDFGISGSLQGDMTSVIKTVSEGSLNYISPEALTNNNSCNSPNGKNPKFKLNYKSDVWSLGCILYQLIYGKAPFQQLSPFARLTAIADSEHKIDYPEANWIPSKLIQTTKNCLQYNNKLRPTIDELITEYNDFYH